MNKLLLLCIALLPAVAAFGQRQVVDLPDGWKFIRHDAAADAPVGADWQAVTVPHCWNALDGQNGKAADPGEPDGYYRGPAWYARSLAIPADWKTRRVFIRFEAAFLVADVYLNGAHLGQHRGGFAAFCYELTPHLNFGAANELRVRVDNAKNADIAPLTADFTMEGGIYRPVHLLVTDPACITPLDFAGPGVYATPANVSAAGADVAVETKLDNTATGELKVTTEIRDAEGKTLLRQEAGANTASVRQSFHVDHPHLWNGLKDPYLYSVDVALQRGGKIIDEVTQPLGLRSVEVDQQRGFLLNGEPYPIHGVNRHQEWRDKGWALTPADHAADFRYIREMGATAVRLAHYQQSSVVHDLCDHSGILLWQEIPLVNEITASDAFADNARQQLTEMIRQGSNHPSIIAWSLFNELYNKKTAPCEPLIESLAKLERELDPSRVPAGVSDHPDRKELNQIPEWLGINLYPGWYSPGGPGRFTQDVRKFVDGIGGKRVAVTEYGAGSNTRQHQEGELTQPKPSGDFHPEEWQDLIHETDWAEARTNPSLWGTFLWVMFDFASDGRNEGSNPGVNDKGMMTEDRKIKKDCFFFYKANWTTVPTLHIASRRMTPRKQAQTEVKAYSNCDEVELKLNGQSLGAVKPDDLRICRWTRVQLKPGNNEVDMTGRAAGKTVADHCEWTLEPN